MKTWNKYQSILEPANILLQQKKNQRHLDDRWQKQKTKQKQEFDS